MLKNDMDIKVSIIIPVYNGANYLAYAIESALEQSYQNIEVIVVNDGSNDDGATEKVALSYGDRIRYLKKINGGVSSALNLGIQNMTGEYFSWLSHDDVYSKNKIKNAVDLLKDNNLLGKKCVAYTGCYFIDSNGRKIKKLKEFFIKEKIYSGLEVVDIMTRKGTLSGCCLLIPKEAFDNVGLFNEELRYSQDSLMWYQLFLGGYSLISDNKPNVMSRIHENQVSQTRRDLLEHDILYIAKILANSLLDADESNRIFMQYCKRLTRNKCYEALQYMLNVAKQKDRITKMQFLQIHIQKKIGAMRYYVIKLYKLYLIRLRK